MKRRSLRNFIKPQPSPVWSKLDLKITVNTGMMATLAGASVNGEESIRTIPQKNSLKRNYRNNSSDLTPKATFTFEALPSGDLLNAPLSLGAITLVLLWRTLVLT